MKKAVKKTAKKTPTGKSAKKTPSASLDLSLVLKKSKDVLGRKNPDGTVALLNLKQDSHFYSIDGMAAEFWLLIDGRKTIGQIKKALADKHSPPEPRFSTDVKQLIGTLKKFDLVDL